MAPVSFDLNTAKLGAGEMEQGLTSTTAEAEMIYWS